MYLLDLYVLNTLRVVALCNTSPLLKKVVLSRQYVPNGDILPSDLHDIGNFILKMLFNYG